MKITTIEPTDDSCFVNGVLTRIWKGVVSETGEQCQVFVAVIAIPEGTRAAATFAEQLVELNNVTLEHGGNKP